MFRDTIPDSFSNWHDKFPGGVLGLILAGYVPLASQSTYPIVAHSVANYRPHLSDFWANI